MSNPSSRKETVLPAAIHDCYVPHLECELPSSIPNLSLQMRLVIYRWSFDIVTGIMLMTFRMLLMM
jgi:hypothetical protein